MAEPGFEPSDLMPELLIIMLSVYQVIKQEGLKTLWHISFAANNNIS